MSPLPKLPQQGDMARLEQVASGLKNTGGTHGPVVQRTPPGRPEGTGGTPAPRASKQQTNVPPDHQQMFDSVAKNEWVRQYWNSMVQRYPDIEWVQDIATRANEQAATSAERAFNATPFFEY